MIAVKQLSTLKIGGSGGRRISPDLFRECDPNARFMSITATQQRLAEGRGEPRYRCGELWGKHHQPLLLFERKDKITSAERLITSFNPGIY